MNPATPLPKTEIWSRNHVIFTYLPYEADVTEATESELSREMTHVVLQNELVQRMADPNYVRDARIKLLRDGRGTVWARIYSRPHYERTDDVTCCVGTYLVRIDLANSLSAMDAAVV